jgi:hypothetical protein
VSFGSSFEVMLALVMLGGSWYSECRGSHSGEEQESLIHGGGGDAISSVSPDDCTSPAELMQC